MEAWRMRNRREGCSVSQTMRRLARMSQFVRHMHEDVKSRWSEGRGGMLEVLRVLKQTHSAPAAVRMEKICRSIQAIRTHPLKQLCRGVRSQALRQTHTRLDPGDCIPTRSPDLPRSGKHYGGSPGSENGNKCKISQCCVLVAISTLLDVSWCFLDERFPARSNALVAAQVWKLVVLLHLQGPCWCGHVSHQRFFRRSVKSKLGSVAVSPEAGIPLAELGCGCVGSGRALLCIPGTLRH